MTRQDTLNRLYNWVEDHLTNTELDEWSQYCWNAVRELSSILIDVNPIVKNSTMFWTEKDMVALETFMTMVQVSRHASEVLKARKQRQS